MIRKHNSEEKFKKEHSKQHYTTAEKMENYVAKITVCERPRPIYMYA